MIPVAPDDTFSIRLSHCIMSCSSSVGPPGFCRGGCQPTLSLAPLGTTQHAVVASDTSDDMVMVRPGPTDRTHLKGLKNVKTTLIGIPSVYVGAAATAITINTNSLFQASDFPEISSYNALYDEARITKVRVYHKLFCVTAATTPGIVYGSMAIQFDSSLANPTTTYAALESTWNSGFMTAWTSPLVDQRIDKPLRVFTATPDKLQIFGSNPPGSSWFPIAGAPTAFKLLGFVGAPSAAGVIDLLVRIELDVEFRVRL
jgi:hypothetical protein